VRSVSGWVRKSCAVALLLIALAPTAAFAAGDPGDDSTLWEIIISWFAEDQARIRVPAG
jgi:hypothetical protein